jgi:hypothetical protein
VETGHTVVLGWAEQSLTIIRELATANSSEGGGIIAVLSDAEKQDMERELYSYITESELMGTKVVFRSGSRLRTADMRRVALESARSVIIVSDVRLDPDTADAEVRCAAARARMAASGRTRCVRIVGACTMWGADKLCVRVCVRASCMPGAASGAEPDDAKPDRWLQRRG